MSIDDFIITTFCLIDDELKKVLACKKLRQRGLALGLKDSEVITIYCADAQVLAESLRHYLYEGKIFFLAKHPRLQAF